MLSADDVLQTRFPSTKFAEGYDQDEVDDFLDRVVEALRARQDGRVVAGALTPEEVTAVRFSSTKFREGYDQDAVDDLLEQVVVALGGSPRPFDAGVAPRVVPTEEPIPGLVAPRRGLFARIFGR